MEMHHKLRRDPSWDPRGCNLCGQLGHQAAECPNGTVNWKAIYGEETFILRPPVYESQLRAKRQLRTVDEDDVRAKAEAYAKGLAEQQGLAWEQVLATAEASHKVVIEKVEVQPAAAAAASGGGAGAAGAAAGGEPPEAGLPDGWAVAHDPSGKPYYYHKVTMATQWTKPTA